MCVCACGGEEVGQKHETEKMKFCVAEVSSSRVRKQGKKIASHSCNGARVDVSRAQSIDLGVSERFFVVVVVVEKHDRFSSHKRRCGGF